MQTNPTENHEEWVSMFQSDQKIVPRSVSGRFSRLRWLMVFFTQVLFYGMAWLQYNGRQALLFDLDARRFFIGPLVLYPQDFIYFTALLVVCALSLFLFTAVAGGCGVVTRAPKLFIPKCSCGWSVKLKGIGMRA